MALSFGPIPGGWDGSKIRPIPKARGAGGSRVVPKRPPIQPGLPMPAASNMFTGLSGREMGQPMPGFVKTDFFFPGHKKLEAKRRASWHKGNKIRALAPKRTNRFFAESTHNGLIVANSRNPLIEIEPHTLFEESNVRQRTRRPIRSVAAALKFPAREFKRVNQEIMRARQIQGAHRREAKSVDHTKVKKRKKFGQDGYDSDYGSKKKRKK